MLLNDKQAGDEDDENLQYYITDLKNEREKYYQQIEETIVDLKKDINKKCAQISIDEEANIKKYKIEFLKKIAKFFQ